MHTNWLASNSVKLYHYVVFFRHINAKLEPAAVPVTVIGRNIQPEDIQFVGVVKVCLASLW